MEPNDGTKEFAKPRIGIGRSAVAVVLLACSWSAAALGASSLNIDCDRAGRDFLSRSIPTDELSVSVVDLTSDDSSIGLERSIDEAVDSDESIAPLLYLAPRVASILDDVFDQGSAKDGPTAAIQETSVAPMADSADEPTAPQSSDTELTLEVQPALIRIQREMYRTDI